MPCYRPLEAWITDERHPSGGRVISFGRHTQQDKAVDLPCGRCIGCRLERSRQWAVRLMHEYQLHDQASFLTLTYDDAHLPSNGSLDLKHCQDFLKRLRRWQDLEFPGARLRYFLAGEYGDQNLRPHYHLILFGQDFVHDRSVVAHGSSDDPLYESPSLSDIWNFGRSWIGDVTFESAAYVARYCVKKITGDLAEAHYGGRKPEFATMSRRPGIGAGWFERYGSEVFPADRVIVRGKECKPPRAYDRYLEANAEEEYAKLKKNRELALEDPVVKERNWVESAPSRMRVKETVKRAQIGSLKRTL